MSMTAASGCLLHRTVSLDGIDSRISSEPLVESQQQAVGQLRGVTVEQATPKDRGK